MSGEGRHILERVWVQGTLELETPTHLGSGDTDALTDMPLLRDTQTGTPLLTGASIAGALRAYVREFEHGYGESEQSDDRVRELFGTVRGNESVQSWLIVDDARGRSTGVTVRDGVALDPKTRTAAEGKKYDIELLRAGTTFALNFELLLPAGEPQTRARLLETFALALQGLERGEIGLGMRKRRGLGQCRVTEWTVRRYNLAVPADLVAWLEGGSDQGNAGDHIAALLDVDLSSLREEDARECFELRATMALQGSLLIRSAGESPEAPDMVHLHSMRDGELVPIISGTSLGGAVRARALRIANTLFEKDGEALIDGMFGPRIEGQTGGADPDPRGSRVIVYESEIVGMTDKVQQRVKIDRFTGGAYPQALFAQQPLFAEGGSETELHLELRRPADHEIGLLLLVLKDLWTGDLALGGERSVGRGRMRGREATLRLQRKGERATTWSLRQPEVDNPYLEFGGDGSVSQLEGFVEALNSYSPEGGKA